ncbi:MAG: hypothetical protein N3D80_07915 [Ignavibacterium album]|uniref:hypothetical protein n=1 Tax=Ignavibacterium album TaxID=591197 RepID=UPI0026F1E781|nr:hypothetical protein [Ignavibacterium album]MCX8105777.1 hypothetical protein [Ignavibacterium album]
MEKSRSEIIKRWAKLILPTVAGIIGGYLYYYYVGCNRGCAITSNPYTSMLWGGAIGLLLTNWKSKPKQKEENINEG